MDSDDSESIRIPMLEQRTDGGTPSCSDWEDIMESDDSERGDSEVRTNWPYEMRTFTPPPPPPLWKRRGRKYSSLRKHETDVEDYFENSGDEAFWNNLIYKRMHGIDVNTSSQSESTGSTEFVTSSCGDSDDEFFRNEEWPIPEHTVIPRKTADNVNRTVRNTNKNRGRCSGPGSENGINSGANSSQIDRPFTILTTAGDGIQNDSLSVDYVKCGKIPVTKLIPVGVLDTE